MVGYLEVYCLEPLQVTRAPCKVMHIGVATYSTMVLRQRVFSWFAASRDTATLLILASLCTGVVWLVFTEGDLNRDKVCSEESEVAPPLIRYGPSTRGWPTLTGGVNEVVQIISSVMLKGLYARYTVVGSTIAWRYRVFSVHSGVLYRTSSKIHVSQW